ncbi:tripartite tricarboxylate transporter substrate binding protein [Bacillaceae bacterium]
MRKNVVYLLCLVFVVSLVWGLAACGSQQSAGEPRDQQAQGEQANSGEQANKEKIDYPQKPLNWTIVFGPGGGNDIMSRTIIDILQKYELYTQPIVAENREGGSGAVGWGYVNKHRGDAYHITSTSGSFITTPLVSDTGFNYESFTPIALLATDDMVFLVRGDAEYETLEDFIQAAKGGKKMSIGGIGAVNVDAIIPKLLAKAAGFTFEYVPFQGDGELTSALLSKSVDAIMANPAEALGHIEAGKMKALAFSGKKRIPQLPDIPTFIELGYDVSLPMPRGIVMPADVPAEVQEWWIETMKKVAQTPEWKAYINDNSLTEYMLFGEDFRKYLEETNATFERVLKEVGVLK